MKNILYCFTGTGNSLATAKDISGRISGETEIRRMVSHGKLRHETADADRIGFIFPVHVWGVPEIVRKGIDAIQLSSAAYVFAIATCGGTPGGTMGQLNKALRRKKCSLSAGFTVRHESAKLGMESPLITFVGKRAGKPVRHWSERLDEICGVIERREHRPVEQNNIQTRLIGNFFSSMVSKMVPGLDKVFSVNKNCNGCGTCRQICAADNITLENDRPVWHHRCLQCLACVHWCPTSAIEIGETSSGKPRYHNPNITLREMIKAVK